MKPLMSPPAQIERLDNSALGCLREKGYPLQSLQQEYRKYSRWNFLLKSLFIEKLLQLGLRIPAYFFMIARPKTFQRDMVKRILLVKFGHLGDKLFFEPVIRHIKENFPSAKITIVTNDAHSELFRKFLGRHPHELLIFNHPRCVKPHEKKATLSDCFLLLAKLRKRRFDLALDFKGRPLTSMLVILSGAGYIVGYSNTAMRFFYQKPLINTFNLHETSRNNNVLQALDLNVRDAFPRYSLSKRTRSKFFTEKKRESGKKLIGVHIGSGWKPRSYPSSSFARLIELLNQSYHVIIVYSKEEIETSRKFLDKGNITKVYNPTLGEMARILKSCDLFIGSDSGPVHFSQILDVPTIAIFSSGDYLRWGTFQKDSIVIRSSIPCSPCGIEGISPPTPEDHCIRGFASCPILRTIKAEDIYQVVQNHFKRINRARRPIT